MTAVTVDSEHFYDQWKDGYRDGLNAALEVAKVHANDPTATLQDLLKVLQTLTKSHVLDTHREDPLT